MEKLDIKLKERSYPIYITGSYDNLGKCIHTSGIKGKIAIITDINVDAFQYQFCVDSLDGYDWEIYKYVMNPGEENKTLDTIREIFSYLKSLKFERSSTIIALGGGVVGDVAGFAAATFLRGINFVQVPTTLLAQADSSVGGKVGVDFEGSKNIIGAFYQPKLVYININSLKTLPKRQILSGLAEVIKHGLILNKDFFDYIDNNSDKILSLDSEVMEHITSSNCIIKGGVVEKDEKETGPRAIYPLLLSF
jgi:3-dehydroquinate synthase